MGAKRKRKKKKSVSVVCRWQGANLNSITCDMGAPLQSRPTLLFEPQQQLSVSFAGLISFYGARRPPSNENISCRRGVEKRGAGKGLFNDYTQDVLAVETEDMSTTAIIIIIQLFSIIFSLCFYQEEFMFLCFVRHFILFQSFISSAKGTFLKCGGRFTHVIMQN